MQTSCIHQSFCFSHRSYQRCNPSTWIEPLNPSQLGFCGRSPTSAFSKSIQKKTLSASLNANDGHPSMSVGEQISSGNHAPTSEAELPFRKWSPSKYIWRGLSVPIIAGQVIVQTLRGKIHWRNTLQQLERIGPKSVRVCLLTSAFVGMAFTIQFVRANGKRVCCRTRNHASVGANRYTESSRCRPSRLSNHTEGDCFVSGSTISHPHVFHGRDGIKCPFGRWGIRCQH